MLPAQTCEQCGKSFTVKQRGRRFCSKACFYAYRPRQLSDTHICQNCGETFQRDAYPSSINQNKMFLYCSPSCRNKSRILKDVACPVCGNGFKPTKSNGAGNAPKRFCSRDCTNIAARGKISPKRTPQGIVDIIARDYPTQDTNTLAQRIGKTVKAIFMIAKKAGIKKTLIHSNHTHMQGANNPNWNGGITCAEWGENWVSQRKLALKRDNQLCQVCFEIARSVHHIKPRRYFIGHMEDANVLTNLITLCQSHHLLVEIGKVPCPTPKP